MTIEKLNRILKDQYFLAYFKEDLTCFHNNNKQFPCDYKEMYICDYGGFQLLCKKHCFTIFEYKSRRIELLSEQDLFALKVLIK